MFHFILDALRCHAHKQTLGAQTVAVVKSNRLAPLAESQYA